MTIILSLSFQDPSKHFYSQKARLPQAIASTKLMVLRSGQSRDRLAGRIKEISQQAISLEQQGIYADKDTVNSLIDELLGFSNLPENAIGNKKVALTILYDLKLDILCSRANSIISPKNTFQTDMINAFIDDILDCPDGYLSPKRRSLKHSTLSSLYGLRQQGRY